MEDELRIRYMVRLGDSIDSISKRYNVPVAMINRENPFLDVYDLHSGDELYIPVEGRASEEFYEYKVSEWDTISDILIRFRIEFDDLLKFNQLDTIRLVAGMILKIPKKETSSTS